jgi:Flp pilus assembly protein TadG
MLWAITKFSSLHSEITATARQLRADKSGVSGIVTAMALAALMGFSGLAIDVVMWESNQRAMQGAADQAALAAATAFRNAGETGALGDSATSRNAAYATAMQSGYPSGSITVGPFNNGGACTNDGCLQVTITQAQDRYFTGIFLSSNVSVTVSAVGTCNGCGNGDFTVPSGGGDPCVMALDASGSGVITDSGGATMRLNHCNLYNNSPNTSATVMNGGGTIEGCDSTTYSSACSAKAFLAQPDTPSGNIDVPIVTSASPAPDPYAGLTAPSTTGCTGAPSFPSSGNVSAGTYSAGPDHVTVNLLPGVYVFCNGWTQHGQTNVTGSGVFIYVPTGGSKFNANSTLQLSAPTDATCTAIPATCAYVGMTLWYGDSSAVEWNGGNGSDFNGALYAPQATVTYEGNATSTSTCTRLISAAIKLAGTPVANFNNSGCPDVAGPVLTQSGLASGGTNYTGAPMLVQ